MVHTTTMSSRTVDVQHAHRTSQFQGQRSTLEDMRHRLSVIDDEIRTAAADSACANSDEEHAERVIQLRDERMDLDRRVRNLEKEADEVQYLLDTGSILFNYYDVAERDAFRPATNSPKTSILNFFTMKAPTHAGAAATSGLSSTISCAGTTESNTNNRAALLEKYMEATDPHYIPPAKTADGDVCAYCGGKDRTTRAADGCIVCNKCFSIECILVDHDKPSYKEPPKEISYFAYKRVNHFNEWLSQIQGKETTDIPAEVYDRILLEIQKQKINNLAELTNTKVREILKKLRINKYYEHSPFLLHKLTGKPLQHMSPELEDRLRTMFKMIQYPFLVHAPATRRNFLSYSFVIHKMLQLLGHDEFLHNFPMLKSRDKLAVQDTIWKAICHDLGWEFVPSL